MSHLELAIDDYVYARGANRHVDDYELNDRYDEDGHRYAGEPGEFFVDEVIVGLAGQRDWELLQVLGPNTTTHIARFRTQAQAMKVASLLNAASTPAIVPVPNSKRGQLLAKHRRLQRELANEQAHHSNKVAELTRKMNAILDDKDLG